MKTKMCIFNDRQKTMGLNIMNSDGTAKFNSIAPQTLMVVEVDIKEDEIPFFKIWETGQAYLSGVNPNVLPKE